MSRGVSGKRNAFAELFRPEVGEKRDQIIGKMEAVLWQLREWKKKGYEHASESCTKAVEMDGEIRGGWVSPKTWTCSLCGFYAGNLKGDIVAMEQAIATLKKAPESYTYGIAEPE